MSSGTGDPAALRDTIPPDHGGVPATLRRGRRRAATPPPLGGNGQGPRSRRRRVLRIALLATAITLLAFVVVIVDGYIQTYRIARQVEDTYPKLDAVRRALLEGRPPAAEDLSAALEASRQLEQGVAGARFTFGLTGLLPWVGRPVEAVRLGATGVTEATRATEIASGLVADLFGEEGESSPVLHDGQVDLSLIVAARPRVEELAAHVHASIDAIRRIPQIPFFGRLEELKAEVLADAEVAARLADRAVTGFRLLPSLLGADEPQTYFVALQNNADQRGTGGAVLAYALLVMDDGVIELQQTGSIKDLDRPENPNDLRVGLPDDLRWYVQTTHRIPRISNGVNYSPQFPRVARVWAEQVAKLEGIDVHGVIAIDPHGVAYALKGQGEFEVPLYDRPIHAGNVVEITEHDQYALPRTVQTVLPGLIVAEAFVRLVNPRNVLDMGKNMATAFAEKRIQVWSADEEAQGLIEDMDWDGGLDPQRGDFLMVAMNKRLSNKVDYFTRQVIDHTVTVSSSGDAEAVTTVRLVNETPPDEPLQVVGRWDPYALNVSMVNVYISKRARGVELSPDEPVTTLTRLRPKNFLIHREAKTKVLTKMVEAWPGHDAVMNFSYEIPRIVREAPGGGSLFSLGVRHQPLTVPATLRVTVILPEGASVDQVPEGWTMEGNVATLETALSRDIQVDFVY